MRKHPSTIIISRLLTHDADFFFHRSGAKSPNARTCHDVSSLLAELLSAEPTPANASEGIEVKKPVLRHISFIGVVHK